jgi:predicted O-linked N-acetylglucosamine transferase (SPINDLY family)
MTTTTTPSSSFVFSASGSPTLRRESIPAPGRDHLGLRCDSVLYLSPHLPIKCLPQHDELYARIAESMPEAQIVFFRHPRIEAISSVLERHMRSAFAARGVDAGRRLVCLDRLDRRD